MNDSNCNVTESERQDREVDGLFCEEVLREWLQNLQDAIQERDRANGLGEGQVATEHGVRDSHLKLVTNSGRGT